MRLQVIAATKGSRLDGKFDLLRANELCQLPTLDVSGIGDVASVEHLELPLLIAERQRRARHPNEFASFED